MVHRSFRLAPTVYFGPGVVQQLPAHVEALGGKQLFVVTDPGVRGAGIVDNVIAPLQQSGLHVTIWHQVSPNPRDTECVAAAEAARNCGADLIIAVGGGSPIDLAKAVAGLATNEGAPADWLPPRTFTAPPLPLIAIPTTAGTGSEVTRSVVINDTARQIKISLRDFQVAPRIALIDPDLTLTLPPGTTAATGMDALTHAIEAYTCRLATPVSDAVALHAIRIINRWLPIAVADGSNREAREQMLMGSLLGGMAIANADVAAVHCIAESIGGRYDTPHGVANSIFLPFAFAYNAEVAPERHAEVADAMGIDTSNLTPLAAAGAASDVLFAMANQIGIPRFSQLPGIETDDFPWIAVASTANLSNSSNIREMDENDYLLLLEQAWGTK